MLKRIFKPIGALVSIILLLALCCFLFGVDSVIDTVKKIIDIIFWIFRQIFKDREGWLS